MVSKVGWMALARVGMETFLLWQVERGGMHSTVHHAGCNTVRSWESLGTGEEKW